MKVIYVESSFHVISYLIWKWFEFIISFYLTIVIQWMAIYTYFLNNLKDMKDHIQNYIISCKICFLQETWTCYYHFPFIVFCLSLKQYSSQSKL